MDDLSGDGAVHMGEEHLGVAVRGHTAVHHHQGALHGLSPPGVVLLWDKKKNACCTSVRMGRGLDAQCDSPIVF